MSLRSASFIDEVFFWYNTIMYFYCYVYVFLLLCMFCSVYSVSLCQLALFGYPDRGFSVPFPQL